MKIAGVGAIIIRVGAPNVILHNSSYSVTVEAVTDEVTSSASTWAEGHPCILRVSSLDIEVPEDDSGYPEVLGFAPGTILTLLLRRGASGLFDRVQNTIMKRYRVNTEPSRVRRVSLSCEFGIYTYLVSV